MSKHPVRLTDEQRDSLRRLIRAGRAPARKLTHARILLKADQGLGDKAIAEALDLHLSTAWRVRLLFVQEGLERACRQLDDAKASVRKAVDRLRR